MFRQRARSAEPLLDQHLPSQTLIQECGNVAVCGNFMVYRNPALSGEQPSDLLPVDAGSDTEMKLITLTHEDPVDNNSINC